jgi:hypothetical protein
METVVTRWLITHDTACYQQGIIRPFPRYDKCLLRIVEKQWDSRTVKSERFLLVVKIRNQKYMHCKLDCWTGKNKGFIPVIFTVLIVNKKCKERHGRAICA